MKPHDPVWLPLADAGLLQKVYFLYLDWPSGPVRVHSYVGDIEVDGHLWKGVGILGDIESNGAARVSQKPVITLKLSDVPDRAADHMTVEGASGREARLYVGAKDPYHDDLRLIGGIHREFGGEIGAVLMEFQEIDDSGTRRFSYSVEVEFGRSPRQPLTYFHSDADQRRITADSPLGPDTGFRHLASNFAEPVVWTPT